MNNMFTSAPVVYRDPIRGIWAEGDHDASAADLESLRMAVVDFGFLIENNQRLTGAHWASRIRRSYSAGNPRPRQRLRFSRSSCIPG